MTVTPVTPDAVEAAARESLAQTLIPDAFPPREGENIGRMFARDEAREGADRVLASAWLAEHDAQVAQQALFDAAGDYRYRTDALRAGTSPRAVRAWLRARAATLTPKEN